METAALLLHREQKDHFFAESPQSPFAHSSRPFTPLTYYEPNPDLVFTVTLESADGADVPVGTTDGTERIYRRVATVTLPIEGEETTLALYDTGHGGLFLPFRDGTSGKETYGAGRYLDLDPNQDGTVTIDFNLAYNPFCAYDDAYSCALPPHENWLSVPIRAGETYAG